MPIFVNPPPPNNNKKNLQVRVQFAQETLTQVNANLFKPKTHENLQQQQNQTFFKRKK